MPSRAYVHLLGHITQPQLKTTPKGTSVLEFSVPVNNRRDDSTAWYRVAVFGQRGETLDRLQLAKGTLVAVTGTLNVRTYQKDGQERTSLDVAADDVLLLSKREETEIPF